MSENAATPESNRRSTRVKLVDMRRTWFRTADGRVVNLEEASAADFDAFICQYLEIKDVDPQSWDVLVRWQAVNFAVKNGQFLEFVDPPGERMEAEG